MWAGIPQIGNVLQVLVQGWQRIPDRRRLRHWADDRGAGAGERRSVAEGVTHALECVSLTPTLKCQKFEALTP